MCIVILTLDERELRALRSITARISGGNAFQASMFAVNQYPDQMWFVNVRYRWTSYSRSDSMESNGPSWPSNRPSGAQ